MLQFTMDVFDYRSSRPFSTEGVFTILNTDSEVGGLFLRLRNVMTSELHLQWDVAFLEHYVKEDMVPRGLRWDVHPQQGDPDFDSWFQFFNSKGISLLKFLIEKKKTRMTALDREIKEIKEKLLSSKSTTEYITLSTNLRNHLEKEEKDQKNKKQKKYTRDFADYKAGSVFSWQAKISADSNVNASNLEMEVSQPSTSEAKVLSFSQPSMTQVSMPKDMRQNTTGTGPRTPNYSNGGPPPPNRGRGKGMKGKPQGHKERSRDRSYHDRSPYRREDYFAYPPRSYGTPGGPRTPRYDYPSRTHESHYGYMGRDDDHFDRPPYNYNQNLPKSTHPGDFHRGPENFPRGDERNGGREGGGGPGRKRRRV